MPVIHELRIHPIKALDPAPVAAARVLGSGALEFDRRWALFDASGAFVNGKNRAAIHGVRVEYALERLEVGVGGRVFSLERQAHELGRWFSEYLNEPVQLREHAELGFPDDTDSPGPTFVSRASLAAVAGWFGLGLEETRLRFRTNVELDGVEAFWEDRLYGRRFVAGALEVEAVNPCQRCVVPSRDARTGASIPGFQKRFNVLRREHLPANAPARFFDHHYRLAVNTRLPNVPAGATLRLGDAIRFEAS